MMTRYITLLIATLIQVGLSADSGSHDSSGAMKPPSVVNPNLAAPLKPRDLSTKLSPTSVAIFEELERLQVKQTRLNRVNQKIAVNDIRGEMEVYLEDIDQIIQTEAGSLKNFDARLNDFYEAIKPIVDISDQTDLDGHRTTISDFYHEAEKILVSPLSATLSDPVSSALCLLAFQGRLYCKLVCQRNNDLDQKASGHCQRILSGYLAWKAYNDNHPKRNELVKAYNKGAWRELRPVNGAVDIENLMTLWLDTERTSDAVKVAEAAFDGTEPW